MLSGRFKAPARELILDPELNNALAELGNGETPELDKARFDLYLQAVERARENHQPFPDLPHVITDAVDRVVRLNSLRAEGYADMFVPTEVTMARMREMVESASANGDKSAVLYGLAAMQAIGSGNVFDMLDLAEQRLK